MNSDTNAPTSSSSEPESADNQAEFVKEDFGYVNLGWFTGIIGPCLLFLLAGSMFKEEPRPNCEAEFVAVVLACLSDVNNNPTNELNSLILERINLTSLQYQLLQSGTTLDRVGLSANQKNNLRTACLNRGYRYTSHISFSPCR
jgi:hypothetical protein